MTAGDTGSGGIPPTSDATSARRLLLKQPLVTHLYTADPSAHVFEGKLYVYPSHDVDTGVPPSSDGDHFDMSDYHVLSLDGPSGTLIDHGQVLHVDDVPWAHKQMWAPDAAFKNGTYYLFFPAKDHDGIFRIGVATSSSPTGPFTAQPKAIAGSFSIDPCSFVDSDGKAYLYFGGLMGGQLEDWRTGRYDPNGVEPASSEPALGPRVALLSDDMLSFAGSVRQVSIVDQDDNPIVAGDEDRRFFEGVWVHRYRDTYYLSYSTGTTHYIAYATSTCPTGPFVYRGRLLNPVSGWTTHHSIVELDGTWYVFYHDNSLSGRDHLRCIKAAELRYDPDGSIQTINP